MTIEAAGTVNCGECGQMLTRCGCTNELCPGYVSFEDDAPAMTPEPATQADRTCGECLPRHAEHGSYVMGVKLCPYHASVDALEIKLLDAEERIDRWEEGLTKIMPGYASYTLEDAQDIARHCLAEVDCQHDWGPLPEWDNEEEPWEQCRRCKVNRPGRAAQEGQPDAVQEGTTR